MLAGEWEPIFAEDICSVPLWAVALANGMATAKAVMEAAAIINFMKLFCV